MRKFSRLWWTAGGKRIQKVIENNPRDEEVARHWTTVLHPRSRCNIDPPTLLKPIRWLQSKLHILLGKSVQVPALEGSRCLTQPAGIDWIDCTPYELPIHHVSYVAITTRCSTLWRAYFLSRDFQQNFSVHFHEDISANDHVRLLNNSAGVQPCTE